VHAKNRTTSRRALEPISTDHSVGRSHASLQPRSHAGLAKQASQITMYDVKSYYNQAKNMVLNLTEMEAKVRDATNDEPWYVFPCRVGGAGATGSLQGCVIDAHAGDRGRVSYSDKAMYVELTAERTTCGLGSRHPIAGAGPDGSAQFNEIMPTIYSRFMEKEAREWRQIYKVSGARTCMTRRRWAGSGISLADRSLTRRH